MALSTCEAEVYASVDAPQELDLINQLLVEFGLRCAVHGVYRLDSNTCNIPSFCHDVCSRLQAGPMPPPKQEQLEPKWLRTTIGENWAHFFENTWLLAGG